LTGFGLRFRHKAQRKRLPFTAVFGRVCFPVLRMFLAINLTSPTSTAFRERSLKCLGSWLYCKYTNTGGEVVDVVSGQQVEQPSV
jgi:hypothetical protein